MKVSEYLVRTLEANGVTKIFGNPGTTEIRLVKACEARGKPEYVVALSEVAAVPMADGHARATRTLGVVNLHVAPGLGNGMGTLYTAGVAGTPLLVLIGGQDRRFLHTNPVLWGPVEKMAASVCKTVFSLNSVFDAAANIKRALRAAMSPPYGPVALICPSDVFEEDIAAKPARATAPVLPPLDISDARAYARFLAGAKRPALIAAEEIHWSNAEAELERLAANLGAPVFAAPYTGILPVNAHAACYAGYLPPSMHQITERLRAHDALFFIGGRGLRTTLYSEPHLPQKKIWLGSDASVQCADGEFELAQVAETRESLRKINELLKHPARQSTMRPQRPALALPPAKKNVLHPTRAVKALLDAFRDALWFDESGLSTSDVRQWMELAAGHYIINGSGGIGWGLAASVGAAIGRGDRQVVALIGDGSALYASEALWTAEHHGTRMLLVVLSNRRYTTLNEAADRLAGGALEACTLEPPVIDFSGLAHLYSWRYVAVSSEKELSAFLAKTRGKVNANTLLEIKVDPGVKPVTASRHF